MAVFVFINLIGLGYRNNIRPFFALIAFFVSLVGLSVVCDAKALRSHVPSEDITLIHVIRPEKGQLWSDRFLQEYLKTGKPPNDWFRLGFRTGIYVVPVPRIADLSQVSKSELLAQAWSIFRSTPEIFNRSMEGAIVIAMNPKKEAVWMSGLGRNDREAQTVKRNWYLNPKNWLRRNEFSAEFISNMKRDFRNVFKHSSLYDDYNVIGHIKDPLGNFGMYSGILTNGKMIESSKLFVPAIYTGSPNDIEYYHSPRNLNATQNSCLIFYR